MYRASGDQVVLDAPSQGYAYVQVWDFYGDKQHNQQWSTPSTAFGTGVNIKNRGFGTCLTAFDYYGNNLLLQTACSSKDIRQVFQLQAFNTTPPPTSSTVRLMNPFSQLCLTNLYDDAPQGYM
ncbi:hypothetical protein PLESTF_001832700 [Pleodorina starrii]|nr:hypothetical protein PLESTF_001832700 [Pleodorina starrii]